MSGITPGPWHFDGAAMVTAGTELIAVVHRSADARLIAAAPEILKLLYQAHEEMASIVEYNDLYIDDEKTAARISTSGK